VSTDNRLIRQMVTVWVDRQVPVTRRVYLTHGFVLAAVKYAGDVVLVYVTTGHLWTPSLYVHGLWALFTAGGNSTTATSAAMPSLMVWMLPFLGVGVMLTARRALDAALSPWLSILFLVPYLNYATMAVLSVCPSRVRAIEATPPKARSGPGTWVRAVATGLLVGILAVGVGTSVGHPLYAGWLFLLVPFAMGACTGFVFNHGRDAGGAVTSALAMVVVTFAGFAVMAVGLDGLVCVVMALPPAFLLVLVGAAVGRLAATSGEDRRRSTTGAMFMLMALPLSAAIEPSAGHVLHEVQSSVIIDAPPGVVWPHVVAFREIPEPDDLVFRAGVAYPIRARIEGTGVGAVRYCVFSTGAFVEPITQWEPGRRLAFDVSESPAPMTEWSPYRNLSPPHLHGYLRSKHGEFRFVDLGDGRTRLEGSTWYELEMSPEPYWQFISDALIHRIHLRVLEHIKQEVESGDASITRVADGDHEGFADTKITKT
jgi:uncharacterized membrane protein YhaH (DUF805 family)